MSTVDPNYKGSPAPLGEEELLARDIRATVITVLEYGDVGYERASAGASILTGLLMQLLRERGFMETAA